MVGVWKQALALLPLRGQLGSRGRQQEYPQLLFDQLDVLVQGTLTYVFGAGFETRQPVVGLQLLKQVRDRPIDQAIAFQWVLQ